MRLNSRSLARRLQAGFSMVELMVAMAIGLIGTVVIFQVFAVFEGQKRTTTGAGDAQQNGQIALFTMEREARMAGYGINYTPLLGCNVLAYDNLATPTDFTFTLAPVLITEGAAGTPDTITFMYASSDLRMAPAKLTQTSTSGLTYNKVDNRFGFLAGDLMIVGQVGSNCTLREITGLPTAVGSTDEVDSATGNYTNNLGVSVPSRYNKSGGVGTGYSTWDNTAQTGGRLYSIGSAPALSTYYLQAVPALYQTPQLMIYNRISNTTTSASDGIVQLQAMYGYDANADGVIAPTEWFNGCTAAGQLPIGPGGACAAATTAAWANILAVRVAVVARSSTPERPNQTTFACDATTTATRPTWNGGTVIDVTADPEWQCYRYRVFETVIPIRNLIWVPSL